MSFSSTPIHAMDDVQRHSLIGTKEDRRFIHIVPEAGHARIHKVLVQTSPPAPNSLQREVGENAVAGPHFSHVDRAIRVLNEIVARNFVKNPDGSVYVGKVWPEPSGFLTKLSPAIPSS